MFVIFIHVSYIFWPLKQNDTDYCFIYLETQVS